MNKDRDRKKPNIIRFSSYGVSLQTDYDEWCLSPLVRNLEKKAWRLFKTNQDLKQKVKILKNLHETFLRGNIQDLDQI